MADCQKIPYPSKKKAGRAAHALARRYALPLGTYHPYRCGDHWHVGHSRPRLWKPKHRR